MDVEHEGVAGTSVQPGVAHLDTQVVKASFNASQMREPLRIPTQVLQFLRFSLLSDDLTIRQRNSRSFQGLPFLLGNRPGPVLWAGNVRIPPGHDYHSNLTSGDFSSICRSSAGTVFVLSIDHGGLLCRYTDLENLPGSKDVAMFIYFAQI